MTDDLREVVMTALERRSGEAYWRSLDELLDTPELREAVRREFPEGADEAPDGVTRRSFLKLLGASMALAGIGACTRQPAEDILPYVDRPPELTPGVALHYATSMVIDGYATGLLVASREGRPIKVEGNPRHPASLGAAGVYEQASVLGLYDPHRARVMRAAGAAASWPSFVEAFAPAAARRRVGGRGAGLRLLLEPTSSPLTGELLARVASVYPDARAYFHAPLSTSTALDGARAALGDALQPQFDFGRAEVILALDADFLASTPFSLRYARQFADRRRTARADDAMNRLYVAEGTSSVTGGMADHRLRVRTGEVQHVLAAVLAEVVRGGGAGSANVPADARAALEHVGGDQAHRAWIETVARDLRASAGRSIVIAGGRQPAAVHAMTMLLNAALGNVGTTVAYTRSPILEAGAPSHDLVALVGEMRAGQVDTLVILEGNPAYTAPADLEFARALRGVPRSVYLGLQDNETARGSAWLVPAAHYLESWGDARAYDGTLSIVQPLIAPLYGGKTAAELLAVLAGAGAESAHALLQGAWRARIGAPAFDTLWASTLQGGFLAGSESPRVTPAATWRALPPMLARLAPPAASGPHDLEIVFAQDSSVYDGRFADNAWLQELPDPVTKLTWDNAALLSPATAARSSVESGDVVTLHYKGRQLRIPALVVPGHADDSVSVHVGYGREGDEAVARGVGSNAFALSTSDAPYFGAGLTVERVLAGGAAVRHALAITQTHWTMEGRPVALEATLDEYRQHPDFTRRMKGRVLSLYQPPKESGDQWAMTIDLSVCTGCSSCVVACQAENNIPVVGKEGVLKSREMQWLRLDRYYVGEPSAPAVISQPMLCQHCEKAPCEYVCPVNATVHSDDGLNEMVYNRCVGTRFCSNNCPYKVRRFNWFDYNAEVAETERMAKNPDVTVRARGVMEKCTFCVQRIRRSQIDAQIDGRALRDGDVVTACQQACPTRAIVFGSLTDASSEVVRQRAQDRSYAVLHELGTQPRVNYLARITNPAPALGGHV